MAIILAVGGFFMLVGTLLEPMLAGLSKLPWFQRSHKFCYAYAEWQAGSTLQLQRLAHEGIGVGTWSNTTGTVPVTQPGETLATLNISDPMHARLVRPDTELAKVDYANMSVQDGRLCHAKFPSTEQM